MLNKDKNVQPRLKDVAEQMHLCNQLHEQLQKEAWFNDCQLKKKKEWRSHQPPAQECSCQENQAGWDSINSSIKHRSKDPWPQCTLLWSDHSWTVLMASLCRPHSARNIDRQGNLSPVGAAIGSSLGFDSSIPQTVGKFKCSKVPGKQVLLQNGKITKTRSFLGMMSVPYKLMIWEKCLK